MSPKSPITCSPPVHSYSAKRPVRQRVIRTRALGCHISLIHNVRTRPAIVVEPAAGIRGQRQPPPAVIHVAAIVHVARVRRNPCLVHALVDDLVVYILRIQPHWQTRPQSLLPAHQLKTYLALTPAQHPRDLPEFAVHETVVGAAPVTFPVCGDTPPPGVATDPGLPWNASC